MITVWNRKELFCTFDMKKQAEVRDILWKFDISYEMRVSDQGGFFCERKNNFDGCRYLTIRRNILIYVRKEDYDRGHVFGTEKFEGISGNEKKTEKIFE